MAIVAYVDCLLY